MARIPHALHNQLRTLGALIKVESSVRFSKRSLGLFEEVLGIIVHVIGFSALRILAGARNHYGMPVIPFMISGIFVFWIFKTTIIVASSFSAGKARYPMLPRVTQLDVLLSRSTVNLILYLVISLSAFYIVPVLSLGAPPKSIFPVIGLLLLSWFWGLASGLVAGTLFHYAPIFRTIFSGIIRVLMYTSGLYFVRPEVPLKLRPYFIWNPMFHMSDLMHTYYFDTYRTPVGDLKYIIEFALVTFALGLALERVTRSQFGRTQSAKVHEEVDSNDSIL